MRSFIFTCLLFCAFLSSPLLGANYIREWLVLGSFRGPDQHTRLTTDYLNGETEALPYGGGKVGDKFWLRLSSDKKIIEFHKLPLLGEPVENSVLYAATFAHSPRSQSAQLYLGSDDGVVVLVNGEQIYFLDKMRGCSVDEDTVAIELRQGWNVLMFKVSNGAGAWALSARIAGAEGIQYQTDYPFEIPASISKPEFDVFSAELSESILLDENDDAFLGTDITIVNTSPLTNKEGTLRVLSPKKNILISEPLPSLRGGEVASVSIWLPLESALKMVLDKKALELEFETDGQITKRRMQSKQPMDILALWFQPWEMKGWQRTPVDGKIKFKRTFRTPKILAGHELAVMVDVGNVWASFNCNGRVLQPRFKGDSGDIEITTAAKSGEIYNLSVEVEPEAAPEAKIKAAYLAPHHKAVENYLGSVLYSKELLDIEFPSNGKVAQKVLEAIAKAQVNRSDRILKDINAEIKKVAPKFSDYTVSLLGNAHIDLAWLWRFPETIEVCKNTFTSALDNMELYSDFKFAQGQAHAYLWMEQNEPELFERIKKKIADGQWEVIGGTWCEPDKNMPSGESLVRQYLYGKKYFKEKFGVDVRVGFMPDTFGHAASLPQILKKCGIDYYIFYRPWNEERIFWWQWKDGSRILAYRPPNWYNSNVEKDIGKLPFETEKKFGVRNTLRLYGVGDHGGGPTRRDIKLARKLDRTTGYPNVKFAYMHDYFPQLEKECQNIDTYEGEINFVFRGCWTSQAMTKVFNRRLEALLPSAETFCYFAAEHGYKYPQQDIENAWRKMLFNQFHDIFDGSGIGEIYPDAKKWYLESDSLGNHALSGALNIIATKINTEAAKKARIPVVVFNPLNWVRSEPVQVELVCPKGKSPRFFANNGSQLPSAKTAEGNWEFFAQNVPGIGYKTFWVEFSKQKIKAKKSDNLKLRNEFLRVEIDENSGAVKSIYDLKNNRQVLHRHGNVLQLQQDNYGSMTAWRVGLKGPITTLDKPSSITVIEDNELRKVVQIRYESGGSQFTQEVILYSHLPRVDFDLKVDWHHRDTMLKIAFPVNLEGSATFEIPFASIEREQTGEEVVSQKWVDISNSDYGVSLLNDHKYGFDVQDNVIRMSALRSSHDPDPKADEGYHEMSYAIYPHANDWKNANVVQAAYAFNTNMSARPTDSHSGDLPAEARLLGVEADNIVVTACKKSEYSQDLILRLCESKEQEANVHISLQQSALRVAETNMIEYEIATLPVKGKEFTLTIAPYEVKTLKLEF